jgi:hypothetical protein
MTGGNGGGWVPGWRRWCMGIGTTGPSTTNG